ncbi:Hypotetical protein [Gulosibacter molinativorax]|nr:Hypotetical protein [Gulosibacter molinativorax]
MSNPLREQIARAAEAMVAHRLPWASTQCRCGEAYPTESFGSAHAEHRLRAMFRAAFGGERDDV